jgi:hypothetical protein
LSTYIPEARLITEDLSAANRHIPLFVAHGTDDDVVSIKLGRQALALLEQCGLKPAWHLRHAALGLHRRGPGHRHLAQCQNIRTGSSALIYPVTKHGGSKTAKPSVPAYFFHFAHGSELPDEET